MPRWLFDRRCVEPAPLPYIWSWYTMLKLQRRNTVTNMPSTCRTTDVLRYFPAYTLSCTATIDFSYWTCCLSREFSFTYLVIFLQGNVRIFNSNLTLKINSSPIVLWENTVNNFLASHVVSCFIFIKNHAFVFTKFGLVSPSVSLSS